MSPFLDICRRNDFRHDCLRTAAILAAFFLMLAGKMPAVL
jgi:hypothetical protein